MSTFIEITPVESTTKISQYVRIDNDFEITVGVNTGGTLAYSYYDFSGIPSDYVYRPDPADDNVEFVQIVKDQLAGTAIESLTIRIKMFYDASDDTLEPHEIPRAWTYGRPIDKDHYQPGEYIDMLSQTFPIEIWDTRADGATQPVAHTANPANPPTFGRRYANLGTLADRRTILKDRLREIVFNNAMPLWLIGAFEADHQQSFAHWLEMMARVISIDANLNSERKFNLLYGDLHLDPYELAFKMSNAGITGTGGALESTTRSAWTGYIRFGSVASSSPFAYTAPTGNTWTGSATGVAGLTLTGVPSVLSENNGRGWLEWLRE